MENVLVAIGLLRVCTCLATSGLGFRVRGLGYKPYKEVSAQSANWVLVKRADLSNVVNRVVQGLR